MAARGQVLQLYRSILREGRAFPEYNIRDYIQRRARAGFKENSGLPQDKIDAALKEATDSLGLVKRQRIIAAMYKTEKSVMENLTKNRQ